MIIDLNAKLPDKCPEYLAWVHTLPSAASGMIGVQAHHRIGHRYGNRKTSDFESMPLTPAEHSDLHAGMDDFVRTWGKTEKEMIAETLLEAIRLGVLVVDKKRALALSEMRGAA